MSLQILGLNHRTAPLELREKLNITVEQLPEALARLGQRVGPGVVISTCNRLELYVSGDHEPARLFDYLSAELSTDRDEIGRHFHIERGPAAVRHLYRVASGIDSMVIGESEILGQVRAAFSATIKAGVDDHVLSRLFHTAIRTGRRARSETAIGKLSLCMLFGAPSFTQAALAACLGQDLPELAEMKEAYRRRRDLACQRLAGVPGLRLHVPESGMFMMVDVRDTGLSAEDFAWRLLEAKGVSVLPGDAFGPSAAGHVRIGFVVDEATLAEACDRIAAFVAEIGRG